MDSERPNVLMIVLEGARADHFWMLRVRARHDPVSRPAGGQGVRFAQAFTTAPAALRGARLAAHRLIAVGARRDRGERRAVVRAAARCLST